MSLEVRKYRFTKLADKRYPSGYQEGEIVELPVPSAVGCPWWIPVEEPKKVEDGVVVTEVVSVEKAGDTPLSKEEDGGPGLSAEKEVPQALELMFPQRPKKKKG